MIIFEIHRLKLSTDRPMNDHNATIPPTLTPPPIHDIWHVNYNETVSIQASRGWNGIGLVFLLNIIFFTVAFIIFRCWAKSSRRGLYGFQLPVSQADQFQAQDRGEEVNSSSSPSNWMRQLSHFIFTLNDPASLVQTLGHEGAFFLLYQINAIKLLLFMSIFAVGLLIPIYMYCGMISDVTESQTMTVFDLMTIRSITTTSSDINSWLWLPVIICWIFSLAFGVFMWQLHQLCSSGGEPTARDPVRKNEDLRAQLNMRPSELSSKSIFVNKGLPKQLTENHLLSVLEDVFPGFVAHVSIILDLTEYQGCARRRLAKENELERKFAIHEMQQCGTLPWTIALCPGNETYPNCCLHCFGLPPVHDERRTLAQLRMLKEAEKDAFQRALASNYGAGRAFLVFHSVRSKAAFVRRVRKRSIESIVQPLKGAKRVQLQRLLHEIEIDRWDIESAPEPDDVDWKRVSYPFAQRTASTILINVGLILLLVVFTSPVAVAAAFSSGISSGAADFVSSIVNELGDRIARLSPTMADMIFTFVPTLILININALLLNILYYAGRLQLIHTDSGKEQQILRTSAVYLIFSTLFLPSFAMASIDALLVYFQHEQNVLAVMGRIFINDSGTFFVAYVIQRALLGPAIQLLRPSEGVQFCWFYFRAVTPTEVERSIRSWRFYSGTKSALQISVLAVVFTFSTVVPVIVPVGAFYMVMQHWADKYNLMYVRRALPGRGKIARTSMHATVFCLLIYQAAMSGFLLQSGTFYQSSSILMLQGLTLMLALWGYSRDKHSQYRDTAAVMEEQRMLIFSSDRRNAYRQPALRSLKKQKNTSHYEYIEPNYRSIDRYG